MNFGRRLKKPDAAGTSRIDSRKSWRGEGPDDCGCGATSIGRFRRTIAELEKSWAVEARNAPFYPFVTWTQDGPRLGGATLLTRNGHEDDRLLALLSVAHARDVPADTLKHLAWAEREFHRGDLLKSAMHVALTGLPALVGSEATRRLHIAAGILDHGFLTPLRPDESLRVRLRRAGSARQVQSRPAARAEGQPGRRSMDAGWRRRFACEP